MDFDGNFSLADIDERVTRSCREVDKGSTRGHKDIFDDRIGCQKCFYIIFGKVTKLMRCIQR